MRFAVLGPLMVADGHVTVPVNGGMQRLLLAILLSKGGKPVSVDALIDALWGDQPPDTPHKRLSWHIHRLRGNVDYADRVVRNDNGYALTIKPAELDLDEFTRLRHAASTAYAAGDAATAAEQWAAALRLWRGRAYGELGEHRTLRGEAARLEQLRLRTLEQRIDADLEIGRHDAIIEELNVVVAEHPLRERFRGQLMLALHRAGWQAEALDVYRHGRDMRVDQLGLEPGKQLRELHKEILRDPDPSHDAAPPANRPAELPADATAFTGRVSDVERIQRALSADTSGPVVISGPGGIGKSTLAIRSARTVADQFPDGQLYLNLRGATPNVRRLDAAQALGRLLRSLDVAIPNGVTDTDELAARFRSAIADRRLLLVLDDAADIAQVTPLLPGSPKCTVLITSRNALAQLDGATFARLDVLARNDAQRLFHRLTGRFDSADIAELCGRIPLAICVAAARLNSDPNLTIDDFAQQLRSQSQRLSELDDGQRAIRSTFMASYLDLEGDVARVFRRLGLYEGNDFSAITAAALSDLPTEQAARLLAELVAAHLVSETQPGRFVMHDLLRLFARERAVAEETESERGQAVERMLHAYLATARSALESHGERGRSRGDYLPRRLLHPGIAIFGLTAGYEWVKSELSNLEEIVRHAVSAKHPRTAEALAVALFPNLHVVGYWHLALRLSKVAVECADAMKPTQRQLLPYHDVVVMEVSLGMLDEGLVHAERFVADCLAYGGAAEQARAFHLLGGAYRDLGRLEEATENLQRSLELSASISDGSMESMVALNIGMVHVRAKRWDDAAHAFRRAAELARRNGEITKHASATCNLGHVLREAGEAQVALSTFEEANSIIKNSDLAGTMIETDALWGRGDALYDLARNTEARRYWNESADMLFRLGHLSDSERQGIAEAERPEVPRVLR